jgi:hypothetical protein
MVLREIAVYRYSVYAVCRLPAEECQVERFLLAHRSSYPKAVRDLNTMLRDYTPQHGPPFEVEERAKRLRGDICEFRAREKRRKGVPRILFFEDGTTVICRTAFLKSSSTPDPEIDQAIEIREEYFRHKPSRLHILKGWGV